MNIFNIFSCCWIGYIVEIEPWSFIFDGKGGLFFGHLPTGGDGFGWIAIVSVPDRIDECFFEAELHGEHFGFIISARHERIEHLLLDISSLLQIGGDGNAMQLTRFCHSVGPHGGLLNMGESFCPGAHDVEHIVQPRDAEHVRDSRLNVAQHQLPLVLGYMFM